MAASAAQPAQIANEPKQPLYEARFGLPVVRKYLNYAELLRDIRTDKVQRLSFFSQHEQVDLEGPCLVIYKDGSVAQSYVPDLDYRVPYAAKNHGVASVRLPSEPLPDTLSAKQIWTENQAKLVYKIVPVIAIGIVYAATQLAAKLKVCSSPVAGNCASSVVALSPLPLMVVPHICSCICCWLTNPAGLLIVLLV